MDEKARQSLVDMTGDLQKRIGEARQLQDELKDVTASARTRDGMVSVTVGMNGQLTDLKLDAKAFDRMTPQKLSMTIMQLIGDASAESTSRVQELMAPFMPEGYAPGDDLTKLMPDMDDLTNLLPNAEEISKLIGGSGFKDLFPKPGKD